MNIQSPWRAFLLTAVVLPALPGATLLTPGVPVLETFNTAPAAADWSTASMAGTSAVVESVSLFDGIVNTGSGTSPAPFSLSTPLSAVPAQPAYGKFSTACWNSVTQALFTQPTYNTYAALVATVTNGTTQTLNTVSFSYDLSVSGGSGAELVPGHRVYYSTTGAAGSWLPLSPASGTVVSGEVIQSIPGLNLAPGQKLYVLWADDNADNAAALDANLAIDNVEWIGSANPVTPPTGPATPITFQSTWKYRDVGQDLGTAWRLPTYDDSVWASGAGQLGYGNGDEATVVGYGPSSGAKYPTTYFRKKFTLENLAAVGSITLDTLYDDGAVIYINGVEAQRINFAPTATVTYGSYAAQSSNNATTTLTLTNLAPFNLVQGQNTIAVEVHQANATSSDISFDLQLKTTPPAPPGSVNPSQTRRYRAIWNADPAHRVTLAWEQIAGGAAIVHYDTVDRGQNAAAYANVWVADRQVTAFGMNTCFARLANLQPDTTYYFVLTDDAGTSERFSFRTAPAVTTKPFTFISGGDTRTNRLPRQRGNKLVAKFKPLFVAFGGDMTSSGTNAEWQEWLDDWQLTVTTEKRLVPLIVNRGNHEASTVLPTLFDTNADTYFAMDIGGNLLRYYSLNTEITPSGTQASWLSTDLTANSARVRHLVAAYHTSMRPHSTAKPEGTAQYDAWAQLFYTHGVDMVIESDTHVMKRTVPIKPNVAGDLGFSSAVGDVKATVYTGEGCWGAPLRSADDGKSWTLALDAFNGFDWCQVSWDKIDLRTVKLDNADSVAELSESNPFAIPAGAEFWTPASGALLTIAGDGGQP